MPPKKKLKLNFNYSTPADPQSSTETDDRAARRTARREARLAALQSAREDFDPPFDIEDVDEDEDESDEDEDEDEDVDEENRDSDEDQQPESEEGRQIQSSTRMNTYLNTGFKTTEGQRVAQQHPRDIKNPLHLWICTRAPRDSSTTDRDAPAEPVEPEE